MADPGDTLLDDRNSPKIRDVYNCLNHEIAAIFDCHRFEAEGDRAKWLAHLANSLPKAYIEYKRINEAQGDE